MDFLVPLVQQFGFGGIAGFCVGLFFKKVAKLTAILFGLFFVLLQILAYHNFVQINWGAAGDAFEGAASSGVMQDALGRLMTILLHNLPLGAAFTGGLYMGLKKG